MYENRQQFIDTLVAYNEARKTSISDGTLYPAFCYYASKNAEVLNEFRRDPIYTDILEHVSYEYGKQYLWYILMNDKIRFMGDDWHDFKLNDIIGSPVVYDYSATLNIYANIEGTHFFSPTTLRYIKVLQDIICLFDTDRIHTISEIGVGYGGECRIISDYLFGVKAYNLIDLPEVTELAQVYLTAIDMFKQEGSYKNKITAFNFIDGTQNFDEIKSDLVISNYAFSELGKAVQDMYLKKVILKAKSGYITWNDLSYRELDGYSIQELVEMIPGSICIEEKPLSYINNKIVIWGNKS